jgi:hypothetical protein
LKGPLSREVAGYRAGVLVKEVAIGGKEAPGLVIGVVQVAFGKLDGFRSMEGSILWAGLKRSWWAC